VLDGPAQVWFDRRLASWRARSDRVDVFRVGADASGFSHPEPVTTLDIGAQDPPGFTPFLKTTPDGDGSGLAQAGGMRCHAARRHGKLSC
jgi:hypothetical protein